MRIFEKELILLEIERRENVLAYTGTNIIRDTDDDEDDDDNQEQK